MANDTPFVALPSPPRSPTQPSKEADIRGDDFGPTVDDDEYARAIAYREHLKMMALAKKANILRLAGSKEAAKTLQHKTLALTKSAPSYVEI